MDRDLFCASLLSHLAVGDVIKMFQVINCSYT